MPILCLVTPGRADANSRMRSSTKPVGVMVIMQLGVDREIREVRDENHGRRADGSVVGDGLDGEIVSESRPVGATFIAEAQIFDNALLLLSG